ncbi:MAG: hypothetical protein A3C02_03920 [Candidatus Andersenbacteria bacterium RIFCSPHIGHO2_02_FULL_45_11]|uniref:Thioredoxin domain-containing protein n=1 Tax=Candidatus Andersenbacteria bacterium RIFCSPHIGHO2_12_FULL_45_11 TaxID=1797281 RepID=A0A1G1WZC0_9BACT|nr:MAG: hypothetical protein A3D99_01435 [Candidatus Andersenbacteria bacterium RIFCSPHIGHO2_12_FULL_45_11]OGY33377.1 MAG: hypothetical protein A3C02_03920 [Candidatus Andersenbacteria bacterium RIFCSPHIGHO2_02_FULL_45_11]
MSEQKQAMSVPMAIVIAGALVAGAVYFSNVGPKDLPAGQAGLPVPTVAPQPTRPPASLEIAPITEADHIRGDVNAPITILEYSDLECPFCKVFHQSMIRIIAEYPGKVRWVYRHAPLIQLHQKAPVEANASECAAAQGKFWEFTDVVFAATGSNDSLDLAKLADYAKQAGVADATAFKTCVDEHTFKEKVDAQLADGIKAGLQGTPFNMVIKADGTKEQLGGGVPYEQLKTIIEEL